MEIKMKINKILAIIILSISSTNTLLAATVKSAIYPLNGTYTNHSTNTCSADGIGVPGNISSSFTNQQIGIQTFTPDTTYSGSTALAALNLWLASAPLKGFVSPVPQFTANQDPTAAAGVKLNETPIEWGTDTSLAVNATITSPFTGLPSLMNNPEIHYFVLTSYQYAVKANNNGVQTGYAYYQIKSGESNWRRLLGFQNGTTTARMVSGSYIGTSTQTLTYTSSPNVTTNYTFDCLNSGFIAQ